MARAELFEPDVEWAEITLVLTDDRGIEPVNERVFGRREATDVISLHYRPMPGGNSGHTAELFINVQRAREEGSRRENSSRRHGWGPDKELALYIAHACNHLTGENDSTPDARKRMRRRELRWLGEAEREGLLEKLTGP